MGNPQHVAFIPDGNRRYAMQHGLSHLEGHRRGAERMHEVVEALLKRGVKYVTLWGFSTDNWKRTPEEVQNIFALLQLWIENETPWAHSNGIRLRHIGRLDEIPPSLQDVMVMAMDITRANTAMTLNVAFNYSGRAEIVDAINRLIANGIPYVDEGILGRHLYTDGIPDVDLVIRTANEFRLSNFMLWQTAYSEFYFSDKLWPDFDSEELDKALEKYVQRQRRFGGD